MSTPALDATGVGLSSTELARYARHLTLPGVGVEGQQRLKNAKVLVVGAGGLGSPIISYLIAAGIGQLGVIDQDTVEVSNLQRQTIHRQVDTGLPKVDSATRLAAELNSSVKLTTLQERLNISNAVDLFTEYDLVIDGSDNFGTRYLSNDAAEITGTPLVWGTVFQFSGQVSVFDPRVGPMLRDIFPEMPEAASVPSCAEGGVFGAICGIVGSLMATEALKIITGAGQPLTGTLWLYDALTATTKTLSFGRDLARKAVTVLESHEGSRCAAPGEVPEISVQELEQHRASSPVMLIDVREAWERELAVIPGSIHLPLATLLDQRWAALPSGPDPVIVLVCKTGARSMKAARALVQTRSTSGAQIFSLRGGTLQWLREISNQRIDY